MTISTIELAEASGLHRTRSADRSSVARYTTNLSRTTMSHALLLYAIVQLFSHVGAKFRRANQVYARLNSKAFMYKR